MIPSIAVTVSLTGTDSTTGQTYGISLANTITSVTAADKRMVTLDGTERTILSVGAAIGAGTFTAIAGVVIVNRETSTSVQIGRKVSGGDGVWEKLEAGKHMFIGNRSVEAQTGGGSFSAFSNLTDITACAVSPVSTALIEFYVIHA